MSKFKVTAVPSSRKRNNTARNATSTEKLPDRCKARPEAPTFDTTPPISGGPPINSNLLGFGSTIEVVLST